MSGNKFMFASLEGHSQFRESMGQAATFDRYASGFAAILAGMSLSGTTENRDEAKPLGHPVNSILLGQKGM
jgi:hypothetical protein